MTILYLFCKLKNYNLKFLRDFMVKVDTHSIMKDPRMQIFLDFISINMVVIK